MNKIIINFIGDPHYSSSTPSSRKDEYRETMKRKRLSIGELFPSQFNIYLGDIFHKPTNPLSFVNEMAAIERSFKDKGMKLYAIPGNHDVLYGNAVNLNISSLGNWIMTGLCDLITPKTPLTFDIGNNRIAISSFNLGQFENLPPRVDATVSILIGHAFYEFNVADLKHEVVSRDSLSLTNHDFIVLGHDHAKYDPVQITQSIVLIRPGSLSRGTSHHYNLWREISIARFKFELIDGKLNWGYRYDNIPSEPVDKVFVHKSVDNKMKEIKKNMDELVSIMEESGIASDEINEVFDSMTLPFPIRDYMLSIMASHGIMLNSNKERTNE